MINDPDYEGFNRLIETTKHDKIFQQKIRWKLNEAVQPNLDIVPGFPVNKVMKYSRELMIKSIIFSFCLIIALFNSILP